MSFNLVDLVKDQISDQVMGSIGNSLGLQGSQTSNALSGALPGLLSGLTGSSSSPAGAGALFDAVQSQDDGFLGNMGNLLGGNQSSAIANNGTSILTSLLGGGTLGKLAGAVASLSGISSGNSSSLLGMLAPIVLGVLKKKVFDGGLNAGSLANLLSDQKSNINAAMPQGFSDQLQSDGFFDSISNAAGSTVSAAKDTAANAADTVTGHHGDHTSHQSSGGGGFLKWLLPLIAIAVLAWLALQYFGGSKDDVQNAAQDAASGAAGAVESVSDEAMQAARDAMPEGIELDKITEGFDGVFSSTTEALSGITDADTATSALPSITEASEKLTGLNDVVAGLPDAAKGPIASIVNSGIGGLQPLIEKITAIPGVGAIVEPVIGPMLEMLQGLAG
ncbi:MAG: DUF937 domain-containing protein [Granulosicoccus sp.]|nr:DUF937 domain-containing protein [Granulosicoccus sp.]